MSDRRCGQLTLRQATMWVVLALVSLQVLWVAAQALDGVQVLRAASAQIKVHGQTQLLREQALPYHWDRRHSNHSGSAVFELDFELSEPPRQPYSLYFPLIGNTAQVWLNGLLLVQFGELPSAWEDYSKIGRRVAVPPALLGAQNRLRIEIHAEGGRRGGLSRVYVGPSDQIADSAVYRRSTWRVSGSLFLGAFSLVVAFVGLMCWFTQRELGPDGVLRRDSLYLYAGLAELCWALRIFDALIPDPPLPWPAWGVLMTTAYAGWICGVFLFCHEAAGWRRHWSMRLMVGAASLLLLSGVLLSALSFQLHQPLLLTAWLGAATASALVYVLIFAVATIRQPNTERWVLTLAGLANVAVGFRDWITIRLSQDLGSFTWNCYVSVFFGLALLYIVLKRFQAASTHARELLSDLQGRVAQREKELASTYGRLEHVAREQARTHERERILRDMHDGVGAHISAAIRQLQSGEGDSAEVLRTLRDSMDQLKLSIDAMQLPAGDVEALLAGLRYRLEPRLRGAGIELQWAVDELAPRPELDSAAMRQLQFLVFEAISNVLQHAQARTLRLEASESAGQLRIQVQDDGVGFDSQRMPQSLNARAKGLGAQLRVESQAGRTVVELLI